MPTIESIDELRRRRDELRGELAAIGDFRPGTLVEYKRKCAKPNCHCAQPGHPGWALMRKSGGKHVNRGIPKAALEETRAQIAEHARFKDLSRRFVEASEEPCRARLKAGRDAGRGARKGGSAVRWRPPSRRTSPPRSTRWRALARRTESTSTRSGRRFAVRRSAWRRGWWSGG